MSIHVKIDKRCLNGVHFSPFLVCSREYVKKTTKQTYLVCADFVHSGFVHRFMKFYNSMVCYNFDVL